MTKSPTGRLASKGPNIQNITPKTAEFRKIRAAFLEQPKVSYEISNGLGIWKHEIHTRGPLGSYVGKFDIGWTIGMDGIDGTD